MSANIEPSHIFIADKCILSVSEDGGLPFCEQLLKDNGFEITTTSFSEDWKGTIENRRPGILLFHPPFNIKNVVQAVIAAKLQTKKHPISTILFAEEIDQDASEKFFQAGGDELIRLPAGPKELVQKIKHFSKYQKYTVDSAAQIEEASQMALLAMENSSDLGGIITFVKGAMNSDSYESLAKHIFTATKFYSDSAILELKGADKLHYFGSGESIDNDMKMFMLSQKGGDRVIQSGDTMQINQNHLVLLLEGLPVSDEAKMGRISDTLVMLCDSANRFAQTLATEESLTKLEFSRQRFLTTLSHELKTPMNGILGFSKALMARDQDKPLGKAGIDALNRIEESTEQINAIINTLIDISDVSAGKHDLKHEIFKLNNITALIESEFRPQASSKNLDFEISYPEELSMHSDKHKVTTMLMRIVDNAIKFTDEGKVSLSINTDFEPGKGQRIIFAITDTGIGIDAKDHQRIFTEVGQLNNEHNRRHYGAGLGLYYVNLISQELGGEISLTSEPGMGSTFTLNLPASDAETPEVETPSSTEQEIDDLLF